MPAKDIDQLGELQTAVMEVLWTCGEGTVRDVLAALPGAPPAYTTVLTILQKLTKSGWLEHRSEGRSYVYRPTCSRDEAGGSAIRRCIEQVFGGDRVLAFQQMISEEPLAPEELAQLRSLIDRRKSDHPEKETRDG